MKTYAVKLIDGDATKEFRVRAASFAGALAMADAMEVAVNAFSDRGLDEQVIRLNPVEVTDEGEARVLGAPAHVQATERIVREAYGAA